MLPPSEGRLVGDAPLEVQLQSFGEGEGLRTDIKALWRWCLSSITSRF